MIYATYILESNNSWIIKDQTEKFDGENTLSKNRFLENARCIKLVACPVFLSLGIHNPYCLVVSRVLVVPIENGLKQGEAITTTI